MPAAQDRNQPELPVHRQDVGAQARPQAPDLGFEAQDSRRYQGRSLNGVCGCHPGLDGPADHFEQRGRAAGEGTAALQRRHATVHHDGRAAEIVDAVGQAGRRHRIRDQDDVVGADNIILVPDSVAAPGLPDGVYDLGRSAVVVHGGVATLKGRGALAGGTATLLEVVRRTIEAGVAPADAVKAATLIPAGILGLETEIGSLRPGLRADILAVDREFGLVAVLRGGQPLVRPTA